MTTTTTTAKKPTIEQLRKLQSSPAAFRSVLLIDSDGGPQRLAAVCDDWQRTDFEALDPGWRAVAGHKVENPTLRAWLERPHGQLENVRHCRDGDMGTFRASARKLTGVVAAADKDQARFLRDAIQKLVQLNPWMKDFISVQREDRQRTHGQRMHDHRQRRGIELRPVVRFHRGR